MKEFYVYTLSDPRNNQIFYVGKGKGKRSFSHINETLKNNSNSTKYIKIQNILDLGFEVIIEKVFQDLEESEAFLLEKIMVEKLGRIVIKTGALANLVPGGIWKKDSSIFVEKEFDLEAELNYMDKWKKLIILDIAKRQSEVKEEFPLDYNIKATQSYQPRVQGLSLKDLEEKKNDILNK